MEILWEREKEYSTSGYMYSHIIMLYIDRTKHLEFGAY